MTVVDANILLYAHNRDVPEHAAATRWLERTLNGSELIGLSWITLWAFLRISTSPRVWSNPKPAKEAFEIVREWLALPGVVILEPGRRHAEILERLIIDHRAGGPLVTDAALAALAIEHGATLASTDRDFSRFPELRWENPLAG